MDDMKKCKKTGRCVFCTLPCFVVLCLLFVSCRNDIEKVHFFDRKDLPQQSLDNVKVLRSAQGKIQLLMNAPTVIVYDKPERKTVYPSGIVMHILSADSEAVADITADYAVSLEEQKIIEARKNVVIVDYRSGDTSYLEHIIWNAMDHRIYSDSSVRSVNGMRVTYGDGFESDENFTTPQITRQRGTILLNEE